MATVEKDFKVKNGLLVTDGGSFGGTVIVATPTQSTHATTKAYVDNLVGNPVIPSESTAPGNAVNGQIYFDTLTQRLSIYSGGAWIQIATLADAETLQQHIHDTSIDGNGLIVSQFVDAGYFDSAGAFVDGGQANTTVFANTFNGGFATDNFN